jgi:hypothetical protein
MRNIFIIFLLVGCATNQEKAVKHFKKFEYYGGKVEDKTDTLRIETIVKSKDGKDSIVYKDVLIECPDVIFPKSKTEVRQGARTERAEIRNERKENKVTKKAETKQVKSNNKTKVKESNCWTWWDKVVFALVFIAIGYALNLVIGLIYKWLIKGIV